MTSSTAVVSYPTALSAWGRDQLETPWVRAYLGRHLASAEPGDVVEVFLDVGCCGDTLDVPLRLERVEADGPAGPATRIVYEERAAGGIAGGWRVQSRAGPTDEAPRPQSSTPRR